MKSKLLMTIIAAACPAVLADTQPANTAIESAESAYDRHSSTGAEHLNSRRFHAAESEYREALRIARTLPAGNVRLPFSLNNLATALREQGRSSEAKLLLEEAVPLYRDCPDPSCRVAEGISKKNLALLYTQANNLSQAERLFHSSLQLIGSDPAHTVLLSDVLTCLAWLEIYRNRPQRAEEYIRQALSLIGTVSRPVNERLELLKTLAVTRLLAKDYDGVDRALAEAEAVAQNTDIPKLALVGHYCLLAERGSARGDFSAAEEILSRAERLLPDSSEVPPLDAACVFLARANIATAKKEYVIAEQRVRDGLSVLSIYWASDHPDIVLARLQQAAILRKLKRRAEAKQIEREIAGIRRDAPAETARYTVSWRDLQRK